MAKRPLSRHARDRFTKRWDSGETPFEYKKMLTLIFLYHQKFGHGPSWSTLAKAMKWWDLDPNGDDPREAWRIKIKEGGRYGALWTAEPNSLKVDPSLILHCQRFAAEHAKKKQEVAA